MLRVYTANIRGLDFRPALFKLSAYRLERLESVRSEQGKRQGAGAELLLNRAVRELRPDIRLPLDIAADENGKPRLRDGGLFFSLSHSGDVALCAVSDQELGADIQEQKPFNERLARRFFTVEELAYILASPDRDYTFSQVWALKESYIKAVGLGLKLPLDSFSLDFEKGIAVRGEAWKLWHRCVNGCHLAVCSLSDEAPEIFREIDRLD